MVNAEDPTPAQGDGVEIEFAWREGNEDGGGEEEGYGGIVLEFVESRC